MYKRRYEERIVWLRSHCLLMSNQTKITKLQLGTGKPMSQGAQILEILLNLGNFLTTWAFQLIRDQEKSGAVKFWSLLPGYILTEATNLIKSDYTKTGEDIAVVL